MQLLYNDRYHEGRGLIILEASSAQKIFSSISDRNILSEVLACDYTVIVPTLTSMQLSFSKDDLNKIEKRFVKHMKESDYSSLETQTATGFSIFWRCVSGAKKKLAGKSLIVTPDNHIWNQTWASFRQVDYQAKDIKPHKLLVDLLVLNMAKSLFAPIWTERVDEFCFYLRNNIVKDRVPMFNSQAIVDALDGKKVQAIEIPDNRNIA